MDNKIKEYLEKQDSVKKKILERLRNIILKTLPGIKEEMGWGVIAYDGFYYIAALPKQVNMGFSIIGLPKEDVKLFEGSGKTMRHIKISSLKEIDEKKIVKLIKLVKSKAKPVHS